MTLLIFEGFDGWTTGNSSTFWTNGDTRGIGWGNNTGISGAVAGTLGGKRVHLGGGSFIQHNMLTAVSGTDSVIVGCRYSNPTTLTNSCLQFYDSNGTLQCGLSVNASGRLIVWRGTTATVLGTGTIPMVLVAEYYIEMKLQFSNSANVEVRVNGVTDITLSGVDTTNTATLDCRFVQFACASSATEFDDVYICDSIGSAPYNDFLGGAGAAFTGIRVETLFGSSNNSVQWTPNASTNVSRIIETATDQDTTYNSDSVAGHIDTFNHAALVQTPSTIYCVKLTAFVRKDDVSNKTWRTKLLSGATTQNGTTYGSTTVYQMYEDFYNNDPNTGVAWATAAAVNATQYGYEVIS